MHVYKYVCFYVWTKNIYNNKFYSIQDSIYLFLLGKFVNNPIHLDVLKE